MANYDNQARTGALGRADVGAIDQGLRAYMLRVYNYMAVGLVLTGLAAFGAFSAAVTNTPTPYAISRGEYLTSFGYALFASPLKWVLLFAPVGLVFFLSFRIARMSVAAAQATFWIYAGLVGVSLASIFLVYATESIAQVFFITAATFGAMSVWGYTTQRDLSGMGSFLMMGLFGVIIASLVNLFLQSSGLSWVISMVGVLVFTGLTAYDTQKIKEMYYVGDDGTVAGRKSIMGALTLYLDFINIFLMLLRLIGSSRD